MKRNAVIIISGVLLLGIGIYLKATLSQLEWLNQILTFTFLGFGSGGIVLGLGLVLLNPSVKEDKEVTE